MKIPTRDIPQADDLHDVLAATKAVFNGATTYQEIAATIGKVERQGRYYRRAAEILGFIESADANRSVLTSEGRKYIRANSTARRPIVARAVLGAHIFQRVIPFLEASLPHGRTATELAVFLERVTKATGRTMMPRRASTVIAWLQAAGIAKMTKGKCVLQPLPKELPFIAFAADEEPLLPSSFCLSEYVDVAHKAKQNARTIVHLVDELKQERANRMHQVLTNLVASCIRDAGAIPRCNNLIDLAATINDTPFIFEVKSTNKKNTRSQVRRGVSQLYEYRYLQSAPKAQLVLVIENPLAKNMSWITDYLLHDRQILLAWDGDKKHLHCPTSLRPRLDFLVA